MVIGKVLVSLLMIQLLVGCGGSGGTDTGNIGSFDTTKPVITLVGDASVTITQGDAYTDAGATATDNVDGTITASITQTGTVDTATLGSYTLTYNVSDAAGNAADQVTRTVTVVAPDTTKPVITLVGDASVTITQGDTYTDAGATATDNVDGTITANITQTGTVDTATLGSYTLTYNVSDAAGNAADAVTRTVTVVAPDTTKPVVAPDTTKPVITLVGDASVTITQGDTYTDAGATATDNVDGTITANITQTGTVDTATLGSYTLTYNVSDAAGNAADAVTRTVTVVAPISAPLNDTGITWGGNYPSGNNVGCTGETIGEQDCSHGRDAQAASGTLSKTGAGQAGFDFTKLDANGNALSASASSWSCVKDNHTGLIWEVKTDTIQGTDLHSKNDRYNWYSTDTTNNGGSDGYADDDGNICTGYNSGDASSFCNTQAFVARVNDNGLCGANDWRLPTRNELQSIANLGRTNPAIDTTYFPNTVSSFYWSSSPGADNSYGAWGVYFNDGRDNDNYRDNHHHARLVRGGQ